MAAFPQALADLIAEFETISDRNERAELLIETADRFGVSARVPPSVATQPYPEDHRVPACESDAFVWSVPNDDGTLKFYFDVLNPQGLSAMAMSVILDETLSGAPLDAVAAVSSDVVFKLFGREISMGKGAGLMGILSAVQNEARRAMRSTE